MVVGFLRDSEWGSDRDPFVYAAGWVFWWEIFWALFQELRRVSAGVGEKGKFFEQSRYS